jgi:hypothetical protein
VERPPSSSSALLYASVPCAPPRSAPVAVALLPQLATASAHVRPRSSPSYAQHRAIGRPALQEASVRYIHHRGVTSTSNLQPFPSPAATTVTSASTLRCSPTIPLAASTASPRHHHCSPPLGLCRRGQSDSGEHCLFRPRNPAPPLVAGLLPGHSTADHVPLVGRILPASRGRRWGRIPPLFLPRAESPRWARPSPIGWDEPL